MSLFKYSKYKIWKNINIHINYLQLSSYNLVLSPPVYTKLAILLSYRFLFSKVRIKFYS